MKKISFNVLPEWIVLFVDFLIVFHACILAFLVAANFNLIEFGNSGFLLGSSFFATIATLSSYTLRNSLINPDETIIKEIISVTKTMILTLTLMFMITFGGDLFGIQIINGSTSFLVLASAFSVFGTIFFRLSVRMAIDYLDDQYAFQQKFLIIGNSSSANITRRIIQKLGYPLQFIQAYLSETAVREGLKVHSAPVYDNLDDLEKIIQKHQITDIVLSSELESMASKRAYIEHSLKNGICPSIMKLKNPWNLNKVSGLGIKKVQVEDFLAEDQIILNDHKLFQYINQQTILITGAAGNLGEEICRQLLFLNPSHLILLDQTDNGLVNLEEKINSLNLKSTITTVVMDIRNKSRLRTVFEKHKPDIVFHAAVFNDPSLMEVYSEEAVNIHITGTKNLADLAKDFEVDRFVLVSSDQAVKPTEVMGASKRMAELYIRSIQTQPSFSSVKTKFIIVRHGEILGVNDQIIHNIKRDIKMGKPVNIHHPKTVKSFYSLAETGKFILTSSILGQGGETYILNKNNSIKLVDLVKKIVQLGQIKISAEIRLHYNKNNQPIETPSFFNKDSEYLLPTSYSDIFLAVPLKKEAINIDEKIDELEKVLKENDQVSLIKFFKSVMPEFVSNNKFIELSYRLN